MYTCDPDKNKKNIANHKIPLAFGIEVLADINIIEVIDDRMNYGEIRWNAIGAVNGIVYVVTYTDREAGPHFISVRQATRKETNIYFQMKG